MYNRIPCNSGIGDNEDLKVSLRESLNNRWYPQLNTGWYYLNNNEEYLFSNEGTSTITVTGNVINNIALSIDKTYLMSGPVIVKGIRNNFKRVSSAISFFNAVTPTSSGNSLMYVDSPGHLVLMTNHLDEDLSEVSEIDFLTDTSLYYYDSINQRAWIKRDSTDTTRSSSLYISYVKNTPDLLQEEILLADSDGKFRTAIDNVYKYTAYKPTLTIIGSGTIQVSNISGNTLTPSAVSVSEYTRAAVKYYVDESFTLVEYTSGMVISCLSSSGDTAVVYYEQGNSLGEYDTGIQINPLFSSTRSGILAITPYYTNTQYLDSLRLNLSSYKINNQLEQLYISCRALDRDQYPLDNIQIDCKITDPSNTVITPITLDNISDNTGEVRYYWYSDLNTVGTYTVLCSSVSSSGVIVTDTAEFIVDYGYTLSHLSELSKCILSLSSNVNPDDSKDLLVFAVNQFGVPYPNSISIRLTCTEGYLLPNTADYTAQGNKNKEKSIILNTTDMIGAGLYKCRYLQEGANTTDIILAEPVSFTVGEVSTWRFNLDGFVSAEEVINAK